MTVKLISLACFLGAVGLFACGGGAAIGEPCDTAGSADECEDGALCDTLSNGTTECLQTCVEKADCPEGYDCNGTSGSSIKTCHPDDSPGA